MFVIFFPFGIENIVVPTIVNLTHIVIITCYFLYSHFKSKMFLKILDFPS